MKICRSRVPYPGGVTFDFPDYGDARDARGILMHKKNEFLCRKARDLDVQKEIILMCKKGRGEEQKKIRVTRAGKLSPAYHTASRGGCQGARERRGDGGSEGLRPPSPYPCPPILMCIKKR